MFLAIGIVIGLVLGLTGSGGSVFAVPLLVLAAGVSMHQAVGLSLAAVAASAVFGTFRNRNKSTVLWIPAVFLSATGMIAAPFGQWLAGHISQSVLMVSFAILAVIIALRMWYQARKHPELAAITRASEDTSENSDGYVCRLSPTGQFEFKPRCMSGLIVGGLVVGILSGLFGVGGGFVIVPLLLLLSQISMQQAVGTSLVVISVISSIAFISYLVMAPPLADTLPYETIGWLVAGGFAGMFVGQLLTKKIAGAKLQKGFAFALIVMAMLMIVFHKS